MEETLDAHLNDTTSLFLIKGPQGSELGVSIVVLSLARVTLTRRFCRASLSDSSRRLFPNNSIRVAYDLTGAGRAATRSGNYPLVIFSGSAVARRLRIGLDEAERGDGPKLVVAATERDGLNGAVEANIGRTHTTQRPGSESIMQLAKSGPCG